MINLSLSHPVPTFGDSFTITCYVCGMPSSKEWAQKARSRPTTPMKPYFPFLLQISPIGGACLREDGSTYLCAFCHGSLEAQWNAYESQQVVPPPNRKYNIQKFICAVCAVETYRKRIRALPFQEFPFLEKQRQPGSITLGNNPLAVVCLDCSETLWAQSAEYDRWGLPVHKRHFNWMARPPPPEDSVESSVARLPSGETQLPRCPPIEPSLGQKQDAIPGVKIMDTAIVSKNRSKGKGESPKLENSHNISSPILPTGRKTSLTSTTPPALDMVGGFHNQPPVVTVAPISHTSVISLRKDSIGMATGMISTPSGTIYPQPTSAVYPPAAQYAPYVWNSAVPSREPVPRSSIEAYPYGASAGGHDSIHGPTGTWPWMPHPSADLIRYQNYFTGLQTRSIGESTVSRSPTHSAGSGTVSYSAAESTTRYHSTSNVALMRSQEREPSPLQDQRVTIASVTRRIPAGSGGSSDEITYPRKSSPDAKSGMKSPKAMTRGEQEKPGTSSSKSYPVHHKKLPKESTEASRSSEAVQKATSTSSSHISGSAPEIEGEQEKMDKRELHIPKKRNWQVFMKDSQAVTFPEKKTEEMPPHPKKKKSSLSISEGLEYTPVNIKATPTSESAIDLSLASSSSGKSSGKSSGGKFMIEYLCQSETTKAGDSSSQQADDIVSRTSVIRCAPKVPPVQPEETSVSAGIKVKLNVPAKTPDEFRKKKENSEEKPESAVVKTIQPKDGNCEEDEEIMEDVMLGSKEVEEKGNSERAQEDSTMHSEHVDDDDSKNEDLPNLEQFIKETVLDLVHREKEQEKLNKEQVHQQKEFLGTLGLVTPDKKIEVEIKSIVSRHDRKTLPPLKLRVNSRYGQKIDKKLKELLLKVSLEDPSLFQEKPESDKCDFMAELGMKTAKKSEKTKREIKWRVVLMERMRRELRDAAARGVKHEWEKAEILKKFADCDLDSFFSSLSFASLLSPDEELDKEKVFQEKNREEKESSGGKNENAEPTGSRVCINYPKYIPSYAVSGTEPVAIAASVKMEEGEPESINRNYEISSVADATSSQAKEAIIPEPILKIPVIPPKRRLQSESSSVTTAASDTDDSSDLSNMDDVKMSITSSSRSQPTSVLFGASQEPYPLNIDNLIQSSATYWEQMKRGIDDILNDLESSKEDVPTEDKTSHIEKIRKHLKSQLNDIKGIEKRLRQTGKTILTTTRTRKGSQKRD